MPRSSLQVLFFAVALAASSASGQEPSQGTADEILNRALRNRHPNAAEARRELEVALRFYRQSGDVSGQAKSLVLLGIVDEMADRHSEAMTSYEEAQRALGTIGDQLGMVIVAIHMGDAANRAQHPATAIRHFERALREATDLKAPGKVVAPAMMVFLFRIIGIPTEMFDGNEKGFGAFVTLMQPLLVDVLTTIARLALVDSHLTLADCVRAANFLQQAQEDKPGLASSQLGWIGAKLFDEQMKRAAWRFEEVCSVAPASPPRPLNSPAAESEDLRRRIAEAHDLGDLEAEADLFARLASVYQFWGEFEDSVAAFGRSLEITRSLPDRRRQARAEEALGLHLLQWNRYEDALAHLERALETYRQFGNELDVALSLTFIGSMYAILGFHQTAIERLEEARSLAQKNGSAFIESRALYGLAETHLLMETQEEKPTQEKTRYYLRQYLARSASPLQQVEAHAALASFLVRLGEDQEAEHHASEALALAERLGLTNLEASARASLAALARRRGLTTEAYQHLEQALAIHQASGYRFLEAASMALKALWQFQDGERTDGTALYRKAIDLYERVQSEVHIPDLLSGMSDQSGYQLYEGFIEILFAQGDAEEAFAISERARARAFLHSLGNRAIGRAGGGSKELVTKAEELRVKLRSLEASLQGTGAQPASDDARPGKLEALRHEYNQVLLQLKLSDPEYARLIEIETIAPDHLRRDVLAPGTTMIEFFVTAKRTIAWVIERESFRMVEIQCDARELRRQVTELRALLGARSARGQRRRGVISLSPPADALLRDRTSDLYRMLIEPLGLPQEHRSLILVPHDVLHYLPFAALWNVKTEKYLVDDYTLSYAPSASVLPYLRAKQTLNQGRALIAGDPALGPLAQSLPPLAAARGEAKAIARLLGARPALGRSASESLIHERAGGVDLLHLAAHGVYNASNPSYSRLELAADPRNDGHLEVHEVMSRLDLRGVDLVVLSACETGLGRRSNGDEVVGLTRAFLYAGSPLVLATLWSIDDAASEALMKMFYQRLRQGEGAAEALRAAQREVSGNPRWRSPFFWAAFSLVGDPQRVPWKPRDARRSKAAN